MQNIQFINAGAGSGKTYTLTETLSEDIKAGKYDAGEVLLTTFTRKAAEEIKLKARTRLLKDGLPGQAFKLDSALMGTVHSVGYQFLNKYWYLAGLSPDIKEMPEEDVDAYFKSAIANIPSREDMDALNHFNRRFEFQGGGFSSEVDPFKWQKHVKEIIDLAITNHISDLSENSMSYKASVEWFQSMLVQEQTGLDLSENHLREKIQYLIEKVIALPDKGNKKRKDKAKDIEGPIRYSVSFNNLWKAVELAADVSNKTDLGNDPVINRFVNEYARFYTSDAFHAEVEGYVKLIFKLAANSLDEFLAFKKNHGLVDFNDMETIFLELLSMEEVRKDVASSVKMVMVDEFQDSNPVQLAIFLTLSDIVEESIWVGDPKQAIYGFRGTDPALVNGLFKKIASADVHENLKARLLKRSWRSRADLVNLVNNLFEQALEPQLSPINIAKHDVLGSEEEKKEGALTNWIADAFKDNERISLSPRQSVSLIPVRNDKKEGLSEKALIHWHFKNTAKGGGNNEDWINYLSGSLKAWLAGDHQIVDKENGKRRAVRPGDVALLCRSNALVVKVAGELRNLGMEVSAETEGLSETVEFRIMMNVLQLLVDPYNALAISELMMLFPREGEQKTVSGVLNERIQFVRSAPDYDKESNDRWAHLKKWGHDYPVFSIIEKIRQTGMHLSVKDLVQKIIADMDIYGHLLAFGSEDQRRANLQNIVHYADMFNDHCIRMNTGETISGFADYLGSFNGQAASNNADAVNVMTYHKAKGLEWPVVVLFDLTSGYQKNFLTKHLFKTKIHSTKNTPIEAPLENRFIRFAFWPFGTKQSMGAYDHEILEKESYKETEQEVREEELRLLYVGMTRARDYLITTSFNNKASDWLNLLIADVPESKCKSLSAGKQEMDLFDCGVNVAVTTEGFEFAGPAYEPDAKGREELSSWFEKKGFTPQNAPLYLSPSKINQEVEVDAKVVKELGHRVRVNGVIEDSTLGTLVHNALFRMDNKDLSTVIRNLIARFRAQANLFPDDLLSVIAAARQFVDELQPLHVHRELFMVKKQEDGHVLRGEADLIVERDNDLILIDYKTYQGGKEQFLDPGNAFYAGKYAGQLDAYRDMAEATLGKPVSRKMIFYVMQGVVVEVGG